MLHSRIATHLAALARRIVHPAACIRQLGLVATRRRVLFLKPHSLAPTTRFLHLSHVMFGEIVEVEGPAFAESISEGDIRWIKRKGDFVNVDELVAEIETDKTSVEVPAKYSGTIVEFLIADGEKVVAKQKLYKLEKGVGSGTAAAPQPKTESDEAAPAESASSPPPPSTTTETAKPVEIPEQQPTPTPPPSAPISRQPVASVSVNPPTVGVKGMPVDQVITGNRSETRVKTNRMRQRIAQRLKDAQSTYAMLTTFNEIDMSNVIEMRKTYQKEFIKKHNIKLGLMSPFIRAAAYALSYQPIVNAVFDENEIVYRQYIDISVAVATPKGLVVPVLRNVERQDYAEIEKNLAVLGEKARDGKLAIEDMEGGTFTISNGGVFGSVFGTPIINPPQSAILGMHGIFDRPVAVNGKVEIRPIMTVALTYDHCLIDGREAVTFLKTIKAAVEDPRTILMNL